MTTPTTPREHYMLGYAREKRSSDGMRCVQIETREVEGEA